MWLHLTSLKVHSLTVFSSSCPLLYFCLLLPLEHHGSRCSFVAGKWAPTQPWVGRGTQCFEVGVSSRSSYCLFLWTSADVFSFFLLTIVTNLYNRPKNPGRWIPKKNWSGLPLSKRRGLCTSRCVSSPQSFHLRGLLRCQLILPIVPSLNFINTLLGKSLNFYRSFMCSIRNGETEWINVTKEVKCLFYSVFSRL